MRRSVKRGSTVNNIVLKTDSNSIAASSTSSFGGDPSQRPEQRKLIVANLPWGTRETEVIDIVSHHAFVSIMIICFYHECRNVMFACFRGAP